MQVIVVEFDIRDFTDDQIMNCKHEYSDTLKRVAEQSAEFAAENSETIVKMVAILGMIEAWETGGILGYDAYMKQENIYIKQKILN